MSLPSPGQARLRVLTIGGLDVSQYVRQLSVYETLFQPFRSAQVVFNDTNNVANKMNWQGGEDAVLVFDTGSGKVYEALFKVASIGGETMASSLRGSGSVINLVGHIFLTNQTMRIQKSYQGITGSDAISDIHSQMNPPDGSLSASPSKGMIGEQEAYIVSNQRPLDAIQDIRTRITSAAFPTAAFTYFQNRDGYFLKPLQELFSNMSQLESFTHDATIGSDYRDMLRQSRNIIGYQAGASFAKGGRFSIADVLRSSGGALVSTFNTISALYQRGQSSGGGLNIPGIAGGLGNAIRTFVNIAHDPKLEQFSKLAEKSAQEQAYANKIQSSPACTIEVLIDRGVNCTVGQGIFADIAAPIGDQNSPSGVNQVGGNMLVVNLSHILRFYDVSPRCTTIMECSKDGFAT